MARINEMALMAIITSMALMTIMAVMVLIAVIAFLTMKGEGPVVLTWKVASTL